MASRKASSEGIALLSMYNDEEDEEIDEMDEDERNNNSNDGGVEEEEEDMMMITDNNKVNSESTTTTPSIIQFENSLPRTDSTPQLDRIATPIPTPQHQMLISTKSSPLDVHRTRKGTLTIVDYAHDETAMSPEAEEGEIMTGGRVVFGDELQIVDGTPSERNTPGTVQILSPGVQTTPPQSTEQPELSQSDNSTTMKNEETVAISVEVQKDVDELERFLPPPPKTKCSEALQEKINKFLDLKRAGKSFNAEVRNRKDYRNPDFLLHAVRYQDIDQIGSCFSKDVFDPHGYDKSDYYDELEADMKREMERKDNERKKSQKMEFVTGGTQPGVAAVGPKINMQLPAVAGVPTVAASGLHSHSTATDSVARESRLNKKSKWDKVDGDKRNPLHSAKQDTVSTTGPHASMLSAANAGAGYSAFAYLKLESLSLQIRKFHYPGRLTGILPSSLEPISPPTILRQRHFWRNRRS